MLFSDITDCEMLVFHCIQEAENGISLVQIMAILEEQYEKDWKRSTVCTFITHLVEKGYVNARRAGRTFYYSSAINDDRFRKEQTRQFLEFWYGGSVGDLLADALAVSGLSENDHAGKAQELIDGIEEA